VVTLNPFSDIDVFVAGGGPAGLAAAIAARRRGFRVALADPGHPPIDKACGEGLLPDGVAALAELGVALASADAVPFRGIRFLEAPLSAEACFPSGNAVGVRRTALHRVLVECAERAGVQLKWGTSVTAIGPEGVRLGAGTIVRCRWIIGADGESSRVRSWAGIDSPAPPLRRFGFRRHYRVEPWTDFMEIYWSDAFQIYVTPVAPGEICVAAVSRDPHFRLEDALARMPDLAARLNGAAPVTTERGAVSASRRLAAVWRGRVALVGDASGSVDAITGQGLSLAFRQALALGAALEAGNLARYAAEHRRLARRAGLMAWFLLLTGRRRGLRERALRALAAHPQVFARLVAAHAGAASHVDFAAAGMALGWRMLTP
jgi:flavin-dependent dehydrogenase